MMTLKTDKNTKLSAQVAEQLHADICDIEDITLKKMFGGSGVFHQGKMFGLVDSKGNCFVKAEEAYMIAQETFGIHKHSKMPYYAIPDEVLSNRDKLLSLIHHSIQVSK